MGSKACKNKGKQKKHAEKANQVEDQTETDSESEMSGAIVEEENEAGQWLGSGHIIALLQFSQVVEAHARNLDMVATVALQAFLFVAAM